MVCPYLTCVNNNNSTTQRKDFESYPPQCWSRRKHWEMSGQTPEMEKNHVPPSRRLLQISVQKDIELIGTVSKRYKSCWLLTLTPATFSEGWWLLRPWSSARLRSLKTDIFYSKLVNYVPWLGRQPLHHDPAWPWWGHIDETRGRHRAVDLGTAATFIIRNKVTKDYLHIKLHHICPMIDGVLHAGQCVFSYVRTMLTLKIKSLRIIRTEILEATCV